MTTSKKLCVGKHRLIRPNKPIIRTVSTYMNPKLTIKKLEGHSSNLLTFYLGIVRKYAVLEPMIFSKTVCDENGSGVAATGFTIIRSSLYYGLIQELANIVFDSGSSNPSINNIVDKLKHKEVTKVLRDKYTAEFYPEEEFKEIYMQRAIERGKEFDSYLEQLLKLVHDVQSNLEFKAAKIVRDEFTAHLDLQYTDGNYEYPDICKYGLKWGSLKSMIDILKPLIDRIGFVVRDAGFAWESFEVQNEKITDGYWKSESANKTYKTTPKNGAI